MVLQMKTNTMEQPKEKIRMIRPVEWENTHLEAHENINAAITQFYELFDWLIWQLNSIEKNNGDAEERNFASFSKINDEIKWLRKDIKWLMDKIDEINDRLKEWWRYLAKKYDWIVDTDSETTVELDTITNEDLKWRTYLANIVVNEASPNQWAIEYSFPKTSLVQWEYTPRIHLKAKDGEHAVLEYDFTVILTEI